jgi:urea transport system substrate-binding protein
MQNRLFNGLCRRLTAAATGLLAAGALALPTAHAQEDEGPIKVGILHSLSGTMAVSEKTLKDVMLMLIEEQNAKGGINGRKIEPVVVDPASDWPLYAEKARELIQQEDVDAIFGNWTSSSRKAVLPVVEELEVPLFYPVQYEGQESSEYVFYTGAAPNQQSLPAVRYLKEVYGIERWVLAGTDYVFPRTTNKILKAWLKKEGVSDDDIMVNYTPFGHSDWQSIVSRIKEFGNQGKPTAVISTINGDANVPFYKELANQGVEAIDIPVLALSVSEQLLSGIDTEPLVGHMAAWNYFQSLDTKANKKFVKKWHKYIGSKDRVTSDPMHAHYVGFNMWVEAVKKAGTSEPNAVVDAMPGITVPDLTGGYATMLNNHHITKPALIGEIQDNGQFQEVWRSKGYVAGDAWSSLIPDTKNVMSDWTAPMECGKYDVKKGKCLGQERKEAE